MEKNEDKLIDIKFYNWDNFTEYENELWTNEERKTLEVVFQVLNKNLNDNTIKSFCFGVFIMLISAVTTNRFDICKCKRIYRIKFQNNK